MDRLSQQRPPPGGSPPDVNPAVRKAPTGIEGLDALLGGGLPAGRVTLVHGRPGTGKTVLALQATLLHVDAGGRGVVIGFEEPPEELLENMAGFGWGRTAPEAEPRLHLVDARLDEYLQTGSNFDLSGLLATADAALGSDCAGAWVVLDGLDLLLRLLDSAARQRHELGRLKRWVRERGVVAVLTSKDEVHEGIADALQFLSDCVVELKGTVEDRVFTRSIRITKYRGTGFSGSEFPFIISRNGIEVPHRGTRELKHLVLDERVSTGIPRLDTLLGGGYLRGTSVLVSGAPGTSKTTLAAAFLGAAAERGEKGLLVSFDESADQIQMNARSVGIRLDKAVASGLVRILSFRVGAASAEEHYARILDELQRMQPQGMVIDPVSALLKSGGRVVAVTVAERLLDYAKSHGITSIMTSLLSQMSEGGEDTDSQISTLSDTWISLTYHITAGERNRALSIVKSRGSAHSNQVREVVISANGIHLADVYAAGGQVLMGTARIEREAEVVRRQKLERTEQLKSEQSLEAEIDAAAKQLIAAETQLANRRRQLEVLRTESELRELHAGRMAQLIRASRRSDDVPGQ